MQVRYLWDIQVGNNKWKELLSGLLLCREILVTKHHEVIRWPKKTLKKTQNLYDLFFGSYFNDCKQWKNVDLWHKNTANPHKNGDFWRFCGNHRSHSWKFPLRSRSPVDLWKPLEARLKVTKNAKTSFLMHQCVCSQKIMH